MEADRPCLLPNSLVADGWMNLGVIHTNRRELGAARAAYARALDAYAATVGERHPNARRILGNLAVLELASQNLDAAQRYLDRALALVDDLETTTDPDAAAIYTNYGDLELRRKRPADALAHYARARRMMEASLGADVLWVAFPLTGEAMALVELGRYEEAADAAQRALLIRKEAPAEEREASRFALARARWELGKHEDAMTLAEQARAALDPALPTHTELHAEITRWLADRP